MTARRRGNDNRDYPPEAVEWLCYLRTVQSLGFTLAEIKAGMPLSSDPATSGAQLRAALAELRAGLAQRLAEPLDACPLRNPAVDKLSEPA